MNKKLNLIGSELCPYVQRVAIVLEEKGVEHECAFIDLADKPAWFLRIAPLGQVPVLQVDEEVLFESTVICEYLDEVTPGSLHPSGTLLRAKHRSWMAFAAAVLRAINGVSRAKTEATFLEALEVLKGYFRILEVEVEGPYFSGPTFHMVDVFYGPVFRYCDVLDGMGGFGVFEEKPKVLRWREQLRARPAVRDAVPGDYGERLQRNWAKSGGYLAEFIDG